MAWHVFAAAAVGSSHIESGVPCQDAFAHQTVGDVVCAVVCDGAGSAPSSHLGAQYLANAVVHRLSMRLIFGQALHELSVDELRAVLEAVLEVVRVDLQNQADAAGSSLADYAATLIGVVASADRGALFHIGDGIGVAKPTDAERP